MTEKTINQDHAVIWWKSTDCPHQVAVKAFEKAGHPDIKLRENPMHALKGAVALVAKTRCIQGNGIKLFPLSGDENAVGVEVREFQKGVKQNRLPFLASFGVTERGQVVCLESGDDCQLAASWGEGRTANEIDDQYQRQRNLVEAHDLTRAITEVVRRSCGGMIHERGILWYLPTSQMAAYQALAKCLKPAGVNMVTLYFGPECNDSMLEWVGDCITRQHEELLSQTEEQISTVLAGKRAERSDGRATRITNLKRLSESLAVNQGILGQASERLRSSVQRIKALMGDATVAVFE